MKSIRFVLFTLLILCCSSPVYAATRYAKASGGASSGSCPVETQCTLAYAISGAANGDTIEMADGSYSGNIDITHTNLVIHGNSNTSTILDGGFTITGNAGNGLRVTNIRFTTGPALTWEPDGSEVGEKIRVDHCYFYHLDTSISWGYNESSSGEPPHNVCIDNNVFDGITSEGNYVFGDCDSTESFPFNFGTLYSVVFEDNQIINSGASMRHFIASRCAGRYVVRYNYFAALNSAAEDAIDAHDSCEGGGRTNGKRGTWVVEVYRNIFNGGDADDRIVNIRGGQVAIHHNLTNNNRSWPWRLTSYNVCDCSGACDADDVICSDGRYNDKVNNSYIWSNKVNCGDLSGCDLQNQDSCCGSGSTKGPTNDCSEALTLGVDYFTTAPDSSTYTELTYPHPLRFMTGGKYMGSDMHSVDKIMGVDKDTIEKGTP